MSKYIVITQMSRIIGWYDKIKYARLKAKEYHDRTNRTAYIYVKRETIGYP